ncbi:MAG: prohibitin family protein [Patescibacteria group bacterium]
MTWLIWTIITVLLLVGLFVAAHFTWSSHKKHEEKAKPKGDDRYSGEHYDGELRYIAWTLRGLGVFFVFLWMITTIMASVHRVDYGNVGIIKTFGSITSIRTEAGLVLIVPWQDFEQENVQTQSLLTEGTCYDGRFPNCYEAFSIDSNDVFIVGVLNFHVDPQNVRALRVNIGPNYKEKVVLPRINQILKDETVKFKAVNVAPNREKIRAAVRDRLTVELAKDGIAVEDFLLQNIDFRDEFKQAVEKKAIADQEAEAAERQVAVAEAQAAQVAATAQGAADKLRIEAQGRADANRTINETLTPELIQFQAIQNLSDNVRIMLLPADNNFIIDTSSLNSDIVPSQ